MLSKFSVKKPYTVVVAVVLVLILGYVSFDKMTVDLLPDMNLPYAVVMTTYPGASPEEVEATVTKPVEQAMATISNIKNVSSSSMENASTVILEVEQTANMDSATIEMRESLDQIKGYWPDTVGNPIIMKMNPTMLPVMIPAVSVEGADAAETTRITLELTQSFVLFAIFFWPASFALPNGLRAAGDVMWTMGISIVSMWVFRIGTAYFFSNVFQLGLIGIWIAMTIDWMFRGICYGFRYYSGKWEKAMH